MCMHFFSIVQAENVYFMHYFFYHTNFKRREESLATMMCDVCVLVAFFVLFKVFVRIEGVGGYFCAYFVFLLFREFEQITVI